MLLILSCPHDLKPAEDGERDIFSPAGRQAILRLLNVLQRSFGVARLLASLPSNSIVRGRFCRFLREALETAGVRSHVVLSTDSLSTDITQELCDAGVFEMILVASELLSAEEAEAKQRLSISVSCAVQIRLWMKPNPSTTNYAALRSWQTSGFQLSGLDILPIDIACSGHNAQSIPTVPGRLSCHLAENAITLRTDGDIVLCPLHSANKKSRNLFEDLPDEIVTAHTLQLAENGFHPICRDCSLSARFRMPQDLLSSHAVTDRKRSQPADLRPFRVGGDLSALTDSQRESEVSRFLNAIAITVPGNHFRSRIGT